MARESHSMSKEIIGSAPPVIENKPPKSDYSKCPGCGDDLPPNDDGTPKFRRFPEYCTDCVWKNANKTVKPPDPKRCCKCGGKKELVEVTSGISICFSCVQKGR